MIDLSQYSLEELSELDSLLRAERIIRKGKRKKCQVCGTDFWGRVDAKYCTGACRVRAYRKGKVVVETISVKNINRYKPVSPLRYPGGKACLTELFREVIKDLKISDICYVEPYAGGVGAGVTLLEKGIVNHLVINDFDKAVYSFWRSVLTRPQTFIQMIQQCSLTIDEWKRQRHIYNMRDSADELELGFAFFYLNRTNHSGIAKAGPIGGKQQLGKYKIDARFNKTNLIERVERLANLSSRISVYNLDGRDIIERYAKDKNVFFYIDPPYVTAGSQLYLNAFTPENHFQLSQTINQIQESNWILTYDIHPLIEDLYESYTSWKLEINYSVAKKERATELLIASKPIAKILDAHVQDFYNVAQEFEE